VRAVAVAAIALALAGCGGAKSHEGVVALAKRAYARAKERGVDMAPGPCLGVIKPGWVADVAHNPRRPVDDLPQNQCAAYRSGKADHFVELDPSGHYIRSG
jgi:hypothetical protein